MAEKEGQIKCSWDGDPATWPDYVRKVRLTFERTRARRRKYLGPELVAQLSGRAWTVTQEIDHRRLVENDGARFLIEFLEQRLGRVPVPDAGTKAEELFVRMKRPLGMSMATWCHKVRETYRGLQRALKRARREQGETSPSPPYPSPSTPGTPLSRSSRRSTTRTPHRDRDSRSPRRGRATGSKQTVDEPEKDETPIKAELPSDMEEGETESMYPARIAAELAGVGEGDAEEDDQEGRRRWKGKGRGEVRSSQSRSAPRRSPESDTDTEEIRHGIQIWEDLDTGLPEVLPSELVGLLELSTETEHLLIRLQLFEGR